jgi:nucleotidyltransferase substrate binding protein (TIGR01987 family)
MEDLLKLKIKNLSKALNNWNKSLQLHLDSDDEIIVDTLKSGQIQKFEFSTELLWKTMKAFLFIIDGLDVNSPKQVMKTWLEMNYCSYKEYESLIKIVDNRNKLSHLYKEEVFQQIWTMQPEMIKTFNSVMKKLKTT